MTTEEISTLTTGYKLGFLMSKKTKKIYISEKAEVFLYEKKELVDDKFAKNDSLFFDKPSYHNQKVFADFYSLGVRIINVSTSKEKFRIPLKRSDVSSRFYNTNANFYLLQLKETLKKKYLKKFKTMDYIIPVEIKKRKKKEYPHVNYAYVTLKDKNYTFIFTTLEEFERWKEEYELTELKPLKTNFKTLEKIRNKKPIMINPLTDRVILNEKQIKIINEK